MAISTVVNHQQTRIATSLSTKPLIMGLTAVDIGWVLHLFVAIWIGYHAFHGNNPLAWLGLDAPPYKIGVVALAEGTRAILSMANVWEEEINWAASTVLVLVLLSAGGADMSRISDVSPSFDYSPTLASVSHGEKHTYTLNQCTFVSPVLGRALTQAEKAECVVMHKSGLMNAKWAKNCGCSS